MTKQEYLSASLPYGLKIYYPTNAGDIQTLLPMHFNCRIELINCSGKPIVRPLSDLTKPIVQADYNEGKPFVPIVELNKLFKFDEVRLSHFVNSGLGWVIDPCFGSTGITFDMMLKPIQLLLKWHFDLITEDCEKVYVTETNNPY